VRRIVDQEYEKSNAVLMSLYEKYLSIVLVNRYHDPMLEDFVYVFFAYEFYLYLNTLNLQFSY